MVEVICNGNIHNMTLLKRMGLVVGRDFTSEKGAVAKGRPNSILLRFVDKDKALLFKLQAK
jgi:hypothetical protein